MSSINDKYKEIMITTLVSGLYLQAREYSKVLNFCSDDINKTWDQNIKELGEEFENKFREMVKFLEDRNVLAYDELTEDDQVTFSLRFK